MKVISWNMAAAFGSTATKHDEAWRHLEELDPDFALLQEATPPDWASTVWDVHATIRHARWGCAVVGRRGSLGLAADVDFATSAVQPGVIATARSVGDESLLFVSIHSSASPLKEAIHAGAQLDDIRRCHPTKIWEIELVAHDLASLLAEGSRMLVGGDLNSALLFDEVYGYDYNRKLFDNFSEIGLRDLRTSESEQQTYFRAGHSPYQLDHLFADETTAGRVRSWRVLTGTVTELGLSDHAPIEVVLDLSS